VARFQEGLERIAGPVGAITMTHFVAAVTQDKISDPDGKHADSLWLTSRCSEGYPIIADYIIKRILPEGDLSGIIVKGNSEVPAVSDKTSLVVLVDFPPGRLEKDVVGKIPDKTFLLVMGSESPPVNLVSMFGRPFGIIKY